MLVIDTDVGSDPDDAVALVVAACAAPDLTLVLTNDEENGERARLARHLLDLAGRPEVPVVAGTSLPGAPPLVAFAPPAVAVPAGGVVDAVVRVAQHHALLPGEPVRWLGIGAMTNLAALLAACTSDAGAGARVDPDWLSRLRIVQMGGALRYRHPDRAEHNVRRDPASVATVLRLATKLGLAQPPSFVMSEHTFRPEIGIHPGTALYRHWSRPGASEWERLLKEHHDAFFARLHPESLEHDPLTLSAVLGEPFVTFVEAQVALDDFGRMRLAPEGWPVRLSSAVDYDAFLRWLDGWVGPAATSQS